MARFETCDEAMVRSTNPFEDKTEDLVVIASSCGDITGRGVACGGAPFRAISVSPEEAIKPIRKDIEILNEVKSKQTDNRLQTHQPFPKSRIGGVD